MPRLDEDEDLQLAIALSRSLGVGQQSDEAEMSNPNSSSGKIPEAMMEEEEHDEQLSEQLHSFLSDARCILHTCAAEGGSDAGELHTMLPLLAEFLGACSRSALSLEQRSFVTELTEAAAVSLLLQSTLPADALSLQSACRRFLDCSLESFEHACAEAASARREENLNLARRALAATIAMCVEAEPDGAALRASLERASADTRVEPMPRFDELIPLSSALQAALTHYHTPTASSKPRVAAHHAPVRADGLADALAALVSNVATDDEACSGSSVDHLVASSTVGGWDYRLFARDLRRRNAESLLTSPCNGAKRLTTCCTQILETLELRQHLLRVSGPSSNLLDDHVAAAKAALEITSACMQLLLTLPAASVGRLSGGPELMRLLAALLGCFTLGANLPTGCGASQAIPHAASIMLQLVMSHSLLSRLLLLLRRELSQPLWHANALLATAVGLSWALGAAVPLSILFDPSGALGGAARDVSGTEAWHSLSVALTLQPPSTVIAFTPNVAPAISVPAVELLISVLTQLLRESAPAVSIPTPPAKREVAGPLSERGAASRGIPQSGGGVSIRLAGGFVLHTEYAYTAEQRVELLFSLPGLTVLDTLIGLLLALCVRDSAHEGMAQRGDHNEDHAVDTNTHSHGPLTLLLKSLCSTADAALSDASSAMGGSGVTCMQTALLEVLHRIVHGSGLAASLPSQLKRHLATRHLRAYTLLLQFGASAVPQDVEPDVRRRLRSLGSLLCERRLLTDQLQLNLIRSALGEGTWPLRLPSEQLGFYARVLIERLRVASYQLPQVDDPLVIEFLNGALNSLVAAATTQAAGGSGCEGSKAFSLLTLQHCQLLMLLWHSTCEATRDDLLNRVSAGVCTSVDALKSASTPAGISQWVATLRLLLVLQYMLKYHEAVPDHLAPQLHAQLVGPTKAAPPHGGQTVLASALVAFEPSTGKLFLGCPGGSASNVQSVNEGGRNLEMTGNEASDGKEGKGESFDRPRRADNKTTVEVFSPNEMYDTIPGGEGGASAGSLAALQSRRAACTLERLCSSLISLLDILHDTPPTQSCPSSQLASIGHTGNVNEAHAVVLLASALGAHAYHVTWRLLGVLSLSEPPTQSATGVGSAAMAPASSSASSLHGARLMLLQLTPSGSIGTDAAGHVTLARRCASWLSAVSHRASLVEPISQSCDPAMPSLSRTCALTSGLSICLERLSTEALRGSTDSDAPQPASASIELERSDESSSVATWCAALAVDEKMLTAVLADLGTAIKNLMAELRSHARCIVPPQISDSTDLAIALLGCGLHSGRTSQLLTALGGSSAVGKAIAAIGEPLSLLKSSATFKSSGDPARESSTGGSGSADEALLSAMLTHLMAPLTVLQYGTGKHAIPSSVQDAPVDENAGEGHEKPSLPTKEASKEATVPAIATVKTTFSAAARLGSDDAEDTRASTVGSTSLAQRVSDRMTERERRVARLLQEAEEAAEAEAEADADRDEEGHPEDEEDQEEGEEDEEDDPEREDIMEAEASIDDAGIEAVRTTEIGEVAKLLSTSHREQEERSGTKSPPQKPASSVESHCSSPGLPSASHRFSPGLPSASLVDRPSSASAVRSTSTAVEAQQAGAAAIAALQLALHDLLRSVLSFLHALTRASPGTPERIRRSAYPLIHALLAISCDPTANFVKGPIKSLLALLLSSDTVQCYSDLSHLRALESFLSIAQLRLRVTKPAGKLDRTRDLLVALIGDAIEHIETRSKHVTRQKHVALYYTGTEPSGLGAVQQADESVTIDVEGSGTSAAVASRIVSLETPGDLGVLLRVLSSSGKELKTQILAVLLRLLALPPLHSSAALPILHTVSGKPLRISNQSLAKRLIRTFLTMHEPELEAWLNDTLAAGPISSSIAQSTQIVAVLALVGNELDPVMGTGNGTGAGDAGTKHGGSSLLGGTEESGKDDVGSITVWALVTRLVHGLIQNGAGHEMPPVTASTAPPPSSVAVGRSTALQTPQGLHAEFGDRVWTVLRRMLTSAFTPWSTSSHELFTSLHSVALLLHKVPELIDVSVALLGDVRERQTTAERPNPVSSCSASNASSVSKASQSQPPLVVLEFLDSVLSACERPRPGVNMLCEQPAREQIRGLQQGSEADEEDDKDDAVFADTCEVADMEIVDESSEQEAASLACKVCTFAVTGSIFTEQHWYYCYTCGLTQSEGCCSICVKVCHAGHVVSYSRRSRFFCDCGAGAAAPRGINCIALVPRRVAPVVPAPTVADTLQRPSRMSGHATGKRGVKRLSSGAPADGETMSTVLTKGDKTHPVVPVTRTSQKVSPFALANEDRQELLGTLGRVGYVGSLFRTYEWLLSSLQRCIPADAESGEVDLFSTSKTLVSSTDLLTVRHSVRSGAFDMKQKADGPHARELRTLFGTGAIARSVLSASSKGLLALAEGDKVHIFDTQAMLATELKSGAGITSNGVGGSQPSTATSATERSTSSGAASGAGSAATDRAGLRAAAKTSVGFEVVSVSFNSANEQQLLISGLKDCVVLTLGSRGEVQSRLFVDLMLDALGLGLPVHLLRTGWLPGSSSACFVLTNHFVKVYDLSRDKISPAHYFQLLDDSIKDVAFVPLEASSTGGCGAGPNVVMLAISASGILFSQQLSSTDAANGALILTNVVHVSSELRGRVGASLYYSMPTGLLFTTYADGRCFALRLSESMADVLGGFAVPSTRVDHVTSGSVGGSKSVCAPFSHWHDVPGQRGLLIACSRKNLLPIALHITPTSIEMQVLKPYAKVEGVATAPPMQRSDGTTSGPTVTWTVHEDGSMQCHSCGKTEDGETALVAALGRALTKRPEQVTFPVDFFERGTCVTSSSDISFSGDVLHNSSATNAKARLSSNTDDYISSPHKSSLTLHINNTSAEQIIIGVRVLVGSSHPQHIPVSFTVFGRTIQTQEGMRRWYDVPLTEAESIVGHKHLTITFSGTHSGVNAPVLDAVDIYAMPRADFKWQSQLKTLVAKHQLLGTTTGVARRTEIDETATNDPRASTLQALVLTLRQIAAFHSLASAGQGIGAAAPMRDEMLRSLPAVLTAKPSFASLRAPAKQLLHQLLPDRAKYLEVKDGAILQHAATCIGLVCGDAGGSEAMVDESSGTITVPSSLTVSNFSNLISSVHKIACKRPQNLFAFLRQEPRFLPSLVSAFRKLQAPAARLAKLVGLTQSLVQLLVQFAEQHSAIRAPESVDFADSTDDATGTERVKEAVRPYFEVLRDMLLHMHETVRFTTSATVGGLLLAPVPTPSVAARATSKRRTAAGSTIAEPIARSASVRGGFGTGALSSAAAAGVGLSSGVGEDEEDPMELDENETADELVEKPNVAPPTGAVQFCCDLCGAIPITVARWHCETCQDFDLCDACYQGGEEIDVPPHTPDHELIRIPIPPIENEAEVEAEPEADVDADGDADADADADATISVAVADAAPAGHAAVNNLTGASTAASNDHDGSGTPGALADAADLAPMLDSEGEEDVMLAMAVAMSLGNEVNPPSSGTISSNFDSAEPNSAPPATASVEGPAAAPKTGPKLDGRAPVRMAAAFFDLMVEQLGMSTALDGMCALPYLQLLHRLAMHRDVPTGGWRRLAEKILTHMPTIASAAADLAESSPQLDLSKRSAALEVHVLLVLFLSNMLSRHALPLGPADSSSVGGKLSAPSAVALSSDGGSAAYAPSQKEAMRQMQRELSSHLCHLGLPGTLYSEAQQLYEHFRSVAARAKGNGLPGATAGSGLLTVKQAVPEMRSLGPFFSDEHTKAHADPFAECQRLALDAVLRLAQRLHLPQGRGAQVGTGADAASAATAALTDAPLATALGDSEDLISHWLSLLCHIIHSSSTTFARKQAKKHLLQLCGTKHRYLEVRDRGLAHAELQRIRKILGEASVASPMEDTATSPALAAAEPGQPLHLPYEQQVKLCNSLQRLQETANAQPQNWVRYCSSTSSDPNGMLCLLLRSLFHVHGEALLGMLKLLAAGLRDERSLPNPEGISASDVPNPVPMKLQSLLQEIRLHHFIVVFVLQGTSSAIRLEACATLNCLWRHAMTDERVAIFEAVRSQLCNLPLYGGNSRELMTLLGSLMADGDDEVQSESARSPESPKGSVQPSRADKMDKTMTTRILDELLNELKEQNALLASHPNSHVYHVLSSMLEVDGHFLESEPLHASNQPELPSQQVKLDALKAETKFTESCQIIKFAGSNTIHSGVIRISDIRRTQMVSQINMYCNNKPVNDVGELKNRWDLWKRVKTLAVPPAQAEIRFEFTIPVVATNLLIEYAAFHDSGTTAEKLQCPRCSRTVTDKHGICKHCGDNAYQCRHCRNINYEKLDAFLCNECGFCKHARFDFNLVVKPSYVVERITNEAEREKLLALIDTELQNASKKYQQLATLRRPLERLLGHPADAVVQLLNGGGSSGSVAAGSGSGSVGASAGLSSMPDPSEALLTSLPGATTLKIHRKITILAMLYSKESKAAYESLSKSAQVLQAARTELLRYLQSNAAGPQPRGAGAGSLLHNGSLTSLTDMEDHTVKIVNRRYDCASAYVLQCLGLLESLCGAHRWVREALVARSLPQVLFEHHLFNVPPKLQLQAIKLLCMMCEGSATATSKVTQLLGTQLELALTQHRYLPHESLLQPEVVLLTELSTLTDEFWSHRTHFLFKVFFRAMSFLDSSIICERLLLPCMRAIGKAIMPNSAQVSSPPATVGGASGTSSVPSPGAAPQLLSRCAATDSLPSLLPAPLRRDMAAESSASILAARSSSSPHRRIGSVRSIVAPSLATAPSATSAPAAPVASPAPQQAFDSTSPASHPLRLRLAEDGSTVRLDRFIASPHNAYNEWQKRAIHAGVSAEAVPMPNPMKESADTKMLEGVLDARLQRLVLRFGRRWHARACRSAIPLLADGSWVARLLLCERSQAVREEAASLLSGLAEQPAGRAIRFLDLLVDLLPTAVSKPACAAEYFELLRHLMTPELRRLYLVAKGLLGRLCSLIGEEARRLQEQEDSCMVDMAQGYMLKVLVEILNSLVELPTASARFKREERLPVLLDALLCVRGLVMQKTTVTDECCAKLQPLLTALHEGSEPDRRRFMAACVSSMREHAEGRSSDGRSLIFLFEQLCSLVCPEKPEPEYQLTLNKASTQEEFIRGSMVKNPYSSKVVGPLMRDVKNKICRDLDLGGLIEDDNGMELLVAGKIVKLDLSVPLVYEQVWARSEAAQGYSGTSPSPMVVVYRLQGLDGEATEPIVETLDADTGEEMDPEVEYAIAGVVGETGGLEVMMDILARSTPLLRVRECAALLLKLLQHCCKIKANRTRMLQMSAAQVLLRMLPEALAQESLAPVSERIALTVESLLEDDLNTALSAVLEDGGLVHGDDLASGSSVPMDVDGQASSSTSSEAQAKAAVPMTDVVGDSVAREWSGFLASLLTALPSQRDQKELVKPITRLLPLVTRGEPALIKQLLANFTEFADFDAYDDKLHLDEQHTFGLECLVSTLCSVKPGSPLAHRIKKAALEENVASLAVAYLVRHLPENMDAGSTLWTEALARPALPFVLQLLGGLAKSHVGIQTAVLSTDVMTRLHALERQSSSASKAIGTLAESLLEVLRERAAADVDRLRRETSESKRKAALDKRQRMLKSMGMGLGAKGSKKVIVSQASPSLLEELEEESGHVCVVCGEGETYRPGEVIGCYTFCKRVPMIASGTGGGSCHSPGSSTRASTGGSSSEMCYTSVTHFNLIHFSCHRDATRAERSLKQPKEEWEGATLRNSQTKCNNLLPIFSQSVSEEAYKICVEQWWANLANMGRVEAPRCRLVVHDLKLLLLRFALEESFSVYSRGGGRESNIKIIPYLLQLGSFLLDARASPQRRTYHRMLTSYVALCNQDAPTLSYALSNAAPATTGAAAQVERVADSPVYMLTLSLFVFSLEEWKAARLAMLRRAAIYWRGAGQTRERFSLAGPSSPSASPALRPSRSPAALPSRSPLDPSPLGLSGEGTPASSATPGTGARSETTPASSATPATGGERTAAGAGGGAPFAEVRPMLLLFALVDKLNAILKVAQSGAGADEDAWCKDMKDKLQKEDQAVLKELTSLLSEYEDELLPAADASEIFDVLGLLGEVIAGGGNEVTLGLGV